MTGRHDEPEPRPEAQWYPPVADTPAPPVDHGLGPRVSEYAPDYGGHDGGHVYGHGPSNAYAAPASTSIDTGEASSHPSEAYPVDPARVPPYLNDQHPSGPQQFDHPSGPQGFEHPSGPQRVEQHPSGAYPMPPAYPSPMPPGVQPGTQPPAVAPSGVPPSNVPPHAAQPGMTSSVPPGAQPAVPPAGQAGPTPNVPPGAQPGVVPPPGTQPGAQPRPQGGAQSPYHPQGQVPQTAYQQHLSREAAAAGHDLSSAQLLKQHKRPPQSGWRRAVYVASGHGINLGESPDDRVRRELITRINQPLQGCYKIAMLSLKGGVGKTTTTTALGSTFASLRGDRVIAVDANPDRGTLSQKIPLETTATVRHLLRDAQRIRRYSDVRSYTSQGPSRLEVLASEQDPAVSEAFSEDDYRRTVTLLEHFYNIVLTDCGTGLMHSAMKGVLDLADSLVIVSSGSIDGARSASATLDWLDAHGYRQLVARSVAVINSVRPRSGKVDLDKVAEHFAARCRAVCRIPFDPHLEEGAEIELDQLHPISRLSLLELGATVADDFPHAVGRAHHR